MLTQDEFALLSQAVPVHLGPATQALALPWAAPYAVECNSITGALALGFACLLSRAARAWVWSRLRTGYPGVWVTT